MNASPGDLVAGTRPPVVGASVELAPMPSVHTLGRTQHPLPSGPAPHPPPDLSSAEVHSLLRVGQPKFIFYYMYLTIFLDDLIILSCGLINM